MQRGEDQVTRLGGGDRRRDRLEVSHLTHQDDVGVLPQHVLEGRSEPVGVGTYLALVHDATLVLVEELDGVLDGHDVRLALGVDHVHHGGERGRLPRARRAGDHHEPSREAGEVGDDRR